MSNNFKVNFYAKKKYRENNDENKWKHIKKKKKITVTHTYTNAKDDE